MKKKEYLITFSIIIIISLFIYLIWTDELRFLGKRTEIKKATISEIKLMRVRAGGYYQRVTYEFRFNNKKYINYFTADKFTGMQYLNDTIFIKFISDNPKVSKYVSKK